MALRKLKIPSITLNNGQKMPLIGMGTFAAKDEKRLDSAISFGVSLGLNHFDCAPV